MCIPSLGDGVGLWLCMADAQSLQKEDVLDHIKRAYLPYTVIDVGWWFELSAPRLPSGRIDYALLVPVERIVGDGNTPSACTHVRDIGRYVARVIADPCTVNKSVFTYSEVFTPEEVFAMVERLSGEALERKYVRWSCCLAGVLERAHISDMCCSRTHFLPPCVGELALMI